MAGISTLKQIDISRNENFEQLSWKKGEVIGIECGVDIMSLKDSFILTIPQKIINGYTNFGLNICHFRGHELMKYSIIQKDNIVIILYPSIGDAVHPAPNYLYENTNDFKDIRYSFEKAYSGRDAIQGAFEDSERFTLYGEYLRKGKLIVERGKMGKILEKIGMENFLSEQLRFKR